MHVRATACTMGLVFLATSGCQTYIPVVLAPTLNGKEVRASLNDEGATELRSVLGVGVQQLHGVLQAVSDSNITMAVSTVTRFSGFDEPWITAPLAIRRTQLTSIELKQTSISRTILVTALIVGGAYLVSRSVSSGQQSGLVGGPPSTGQ